MLVGLFGGRSYVQILNAIQYPSDYEHEYALWVVMFVPEDKGEVFVGGWVNVDYTTLHHYLGLEEGIGKK